MEMESAVYHSLRQLGKLATLVPEMEHLNTTISKQYLNMMKGLYQKNVTDNLYKTAIHFGTAGACLGANSLLGPNTRWGLDSMTAGVIPQKGGEALSSLVGSDETHNTGELRKVEHKLNTSGDKNSRELLEQFTRSVQSQQDAAHRARSLSGG